MIVEVAPCNGLAPHASHDWEWRGEWVWCPGRPAPADPVDNEASSTPLPWRDEGGIY